MLTKHTLRKFHWRLHRRVRNLYLQAVRSIVLNEVYGPGKHLPEGRVWPPGPALTMIGKKRLLNLQQCVEDVILKNVPGDLIETGVWKGGAVILMRAILQAYKIKDRRVFAADSFCGIPEVNVAKYPADQAHAGTERLPILDENSEEEVAGYFRRMHLLDDQVVIVPGWFKDTLPLLNSKQIAVLRLDGDIYESTWDALIHLYDKISIGGYLIVDDYEAYSGCKAAVQDFRQQRGITEPIITIDWTGIYWRKENKA
jgi:hypothetical protein